MKYVVAWDEEFDGNVICQSRKELDDYLRENWEQGEFEEGCEPTVYQLGKSMSVKVETKITIKETK